MFAAGCGGQGGDDGALACSMTSVAGWAKAPSAFAPQGRKSRGLSPDDRRRASDSRQWRPVRPPSEFLDDPQRFCRVPLREAGPLQVSKDGRWALVRFPGPWSVDECLARREGDRWVERACDTVVHIEPVIPAAELPHANAG